MSVDDAAKNTEAARPAAEGTEAARPAAEGTEAARPAAEGAEAARPAAGRHALRGAPWRGRPGTWITAFAVLLRLAWVLAVPSKPVGDFAMYWESAMHLVEHGRFDDAFIYMPGYVAALALVYALGGGWLWAKLLGVAAGGLATAAVFGVAERLLGRRAAVAAGLLAALWPAGIAVASVTGTDMPAAALIMAALWALVRDGDREPVRSSVLFGLVMGLAAYVRAVALPLCAVSLLYWLARRATLRAAAARAALATAVAFAALAPWAARNHARYGEWFLTDSHGGLTALVGANPNAEGVYTRSLNRLFELSTGFRVLAEPHREADRAAYRLAREMASFEPVYAAGLVAAKADRLLTRERTLLYWPLYRAGVLRGRPAALFAALRPALEIGTDGFWWVVCAAAAGAAAVLARRRLWPPVTLLAFAAALAALYAVFFAEARYHLPIALMLFPLAGAGVAALPAWASWRGPADRAARLDRAAVAGALLCVFGLWPAALWAGERLRAGHRFAATACRIGAARQACLWRSAGDAPGDSPVRGVYDGFGLVAPGTAVAQVELRPGSYVLRAQIDPPSAASDPALFFGVDRDGADTRVGSGGRLEVRFQHAGGPVRLVARRLPGSVAPVWFSSVAVEPDGAAR